MLLACLFTLPWYCSRSAMGKALLWIWRFQADLAAARHVCRDPVNDVHMGECAERCADEFAISRQEQDNHALESHRRAGQAACAGITAEARLRAAAASAVSLRIKKGDLWFQV